jgi:hypothetical protein
MDNHGLFEDNKESDSHESLESSRGFADNLQSNFEEVMLKNAKPEPFFTPGKFGSFGDLSATHNGLEGQKKLAQGSRPPKTPQAHQSFQIPKPSPDFSFSDPEGPLRIQSVEAFSINTSPYFKAPELDSEEDYQGKPLTSEVDHKPKRTLFREELDNYNLDQTDAAIIADQKKLFSEEAYNSHERQTVPRGLHQGQHSPADWDSSPAGEDQATDTGSKGRSF